jgi:hypothetical protein
MYTPTCHNIISSVAGCIFYNRLPNNIKRTGNNNYSNKNNINLSCQKGCYIRTITARVNLEKKKILVVGLKGLDAKMN